MAFLWVRVMNGATAKLLLPMALLFFTLLSLAGCFLSRQDEANEFAAAHLCFEFHHP